MQESLGTSKNADFVQAITIFCKNKQRRVLGTTEVGRVRSVPHRVFGHAGRHDAALLSLFL